MARILLLNGPNLNLLGSREPEIYGSVTLADVESRLRAAAASRGHELLALQSNSEQALIERIHSARGDAVAFAIVNAGAFTHTSVALRDAFLGVKLPFIEVHVTNIAARESFRHHSYLSDIAVGCIVGLGVQGYEFALEAACARLAKS